MKLNRGFLLLAFFGVFGVAVAGARELVQNAIANWPAPATWSPLRTHGVTTMSSTGPFPFIEVTPCRLADTRGNGFSGGYGPPSLVANATRSFTITGQCDIPDGAAAVSFNFAALNVSAPGDLRVFPAGASVPLISTLNYNANTPNIANAAIVSLGTGGAITVQADAVSIDLIIDLNGYYAPAGVGVQNTFVGLEAGNFHMTGDANTAIGNLTLFVNTSGDANTASGVGALHQNSTGSYNAATGLDALAVNVAGSNNTAMGARALFHASGSNNIGIGQSAGFNLTSGINNICIGNDGVAGDAGTIRIGGPTHGKTFLAGVNGITTGGTGIPVLIDSNGQLGTTSSSARFKVEIRDMGDSTEGLLRLRPVTFRYKAQPGGRTQFGLIGEEVEKVMPQLVVCSSSGEVETVLYHEMPAMLLNELQKQQRQIEDLKSELAALRAVIGQK